MATKRQKRNGNRKTEMNTRREKSFSRSITELEAVFAFIADFVSEFNIAPAAAFTLQLAIEEVFTNLVKYDPQADPAIPIRLTKDNARVTAVVINAGGKYFDMTLAHKPESPSDPWEREGLGLYLVGKMVDEFRYEYTNGTGIITIGASLED